MPSVADQLRRETLRSLAAGDAGERLAEAIRLGDAAVALRSAATGEPEALARRALQRQAARGRRPSRCAER
jgi:hypothetical protein